MDSSKTRAQRKGKVSFSQSFYGMHPSKYGFPSNNQMSQPGQVIEGTPLGSVISIPVFQNTIVSFNYVKTKSFLFH